MKFNLFYAIYIAVLIIGAGEQAFGILLQVCNDNPAHYKAWADVAGEPESMALNYDKLNTDGHIACVIKYEALNRCLDGSAIKFSGAINTIPIHDLTSATKNCLANNLPTIKSEIQNYRSFNSDSASLQGVGNGNGSPNATAHSNLTINSHTNGTNQVTQGPTSGCENIPSLAPGAKHGNTPVCIDHFKRTGVLMNESQTLTCDQVFANVRSSGRMPHPRRKKELFQGCVPPEDSIYFTKGADTRTDFEVEQNIPSNKKIQEFQDVCIRARIGAVNCCRNPLQCMSNANVDTELSTNVNMFGQIAAGGLGIAVQTGAISQNCKLLKNVSNLAVAGNLAMAAFCGIRRETCDYDCTDQKDEIEKAITKCNKGAHEYSFVSARNEFICPNTLTKLKEALDVVDRGLRVCSNLAGHIVQNLAGAANSFMAAKLSTLCEKAADANNGLVPADFTAPSFDTSNFDYDCSKASNASNPLCQSCALAANRSKPECKLVSSKRTPGSDNRGSTPFDSGGTFDLPPDLDAEEQEPNFENVQAAPNRTAGVPRGGGGGPPGGGGGGGGGRRGNGGGGSVAAKEAQFPGVGRRGGGGFSGLYGKSGGFPTGADGKKNRGSAFRKFPNLKAYLPGNKKDPNKKTLGGALGLSRQIAGRSVNIWEKITTRFVDICRTNRLYDCKKQDYVRKKK